MLDSPQSDARSRRARARGWYRVPIFRGRRISLEGVPPGRAAQEAARTLSPHNDRFKGPLGPLLRSRPGPYASAGSRFEPKHTHLTKILITDSNDYRNRHAPRSYYSKRESSGPCSLGILLTHLLEPKQNKMAEQCRYQPRQQEHGPVPTGHVAESGIPKHLEQRVISMYRGLVGEPHQSSRQRCPNEPVRGEGMAPDQSGQV